MHNTFAARLLTCVVSYSYGIRSKTEVRVRMIALGQLQLHNLLPSHDHYTTGRTPGLSGGHGEILTMPSSFTDANVLDC